MHGQTRSRPHANARIENVDPVVLLGVKPVQMRSRAHAGDDHPASHQVQPCQPTNRIWRIQRIDAVPYAHDCARLQMSGEHLARHHQ
jgi:hypothetical protein